MNKPKTIDISNVKYAMASELGENHNFLERLAEAGKIGKVNWNGNNYYEVEAVKKNATDKRAIPKGYVRAVDHAILLGSHSHMASEVCNRTGAPAKKVIVGGNKAAWFVDKVWFEKQLGKVSPVRPVAKVTTMTVDTSVQNQLDVLKSTIAELRTTIQNITRGRMTPATVAVTEDIAREQGYRPLQELATELDVSHSTLLGWKGRGQVRFYKVSGRVYLSVEDVERMYLKLDENRAILARKMGGRTNNNLPAPRTNGVS